MPLGGQKRPRITLGAIVSKVMTSATRVSDTQSDLGLLVLVFNPSIIRVLMRIGGCAPRTEGLYPPSPEAHVNFRGGWPRSPSRVTKRAAARHVHRIPYTTVPDAAVGHLRGGATKYCWFPLIIS